MDAWVFWAIAAVILAVGEVLTVSFYLFPFALGCVAAALVDLAGGGSALQAAAFVVSPRSASGWCGRSPAAT